MNVSVNGRPETVPPGMMLDELIRLKGFTPERVVVEYNLEIVSRETWPAITLRKGDQIEIVSFVGGG